MAVNRPVIGQDPPIKQSHSEHRHTTLTTKSVEGREEFEEIGENEQLHQYLNVNTAT